MPNSGAGQVGRIKAPSHRGVKTRRALSMIIRLRTGKKLSDYHRLVIGVQSNDVTHSSWFARGRDDPIAHGPAAYAATSSSEFLVNRNKIVDKN